MRGRTHPDLLNRCPHCLLLSNLCICAEIRPCPSRTRIVIVRHWKERWRPSNTGRLVALAIPNVELFDYGAPGEPWTADAISGPNAALLFPDPGRAKLIETPNPLIILDASWPQARKMTRRVPGLAHLPTMVLPPPTVVPQRLRTPPSCEGMATIEAVARALDHLEGPGAGASLDALFATFVRASRRARGEVHTPG